MPRDIAKRMTWPSSAPAGTVQEAVGSDAHMPGTAVVLLHNPSTVTPLVVTCYLRWTDTGGVDRDAELATFTVPANTTHAERVDGLGMGTPVVRLENSTLLGAADGFDAELRVEFVGD